MEVRVSKGFVVLAQNSDTVDYITQAYALALSIKHSQTSVTDISLITNDPVPEKYKSVFDKIIPIPWADDGVSTPYCAEHRWKIYHITPYDETIVLDTDMLMLHDISHWWEYCNQYDVRYCSQILNYKLEPVVDVVHRKCFIENKLTSPYSALHYFKKSQTAHEFYKTLEFVCNNWQWAYGKFAPVAYQDWLSMDLAVAIAIELSGLYSEVIDSCSPLKFVHMKAPIQQWHLIPASWQDAVPFILNVKGEFLVGNIKQPELFHYVEKNFLSKKILSRLEELVYGKA